MSKKQNYTLNEFQKKALKSKFPGLKSIRYERYNGQAVIYDEIYINYKFKTFCIVTLKRNQYNEYKKKTIQEIEQYIQKEIKIIDKVCD